MTEENVDLHLLGNNANFYKKQKNFHIHFKGFQIVPNAGTFPLSQVNNEKISHF